MKFQKFEIKGPLLISDTDSSFSISDKSILQTLGVSEFVDERKVNSNSGSLKGLIFQDPPNQQSLLIQVTSGIVQIVLVDIRKSSRTYGKWMALKLNSEDRNYLFVPVGFARGFLTLSETSTTKILATKKANSHYQNGFLWNDSTIGIKWKIDNPKVATKYLLFGRFEDFVSPF